MRTFLHTLCATGLALASFMMPQAGAADLVVGPPVAGPSSYATGPCADSWVLARISSRFRHQVRHVPHLPDVAITDFQRIHQRRFIPEAGLERPIARRYCDATVLLSDGSQRTMWYFIESHMGYAGMGQGVEFCVAGFDRWNVYNSRCRVAR